MCGIAGIFSYRNAAPPVDQNELIAIRDHMALRGPDGAGLWISPDGRIGFAHRRLSIIDLSNGGDQPMHTPDHGLSIVFNGEIYNYQAIRKQLESKGHVFRSTSDTEVLLYAYVEYGESMVDHLRGMYAFAIWRERDKSLFLARDPFGIKPLYYADDGYAFRFASQVKALRTSTAISSVPNAAGHVGFFLWGFVPEPHTLFESIKCLPAGSTLLVTEGQARPIRKFFNLADELDSFSDAPSSSTVNLREQLREIMFDSVRHHLIADVPVGLFLSSGIDSASLASLASEISKDTLNTVTLGFEEYRGSGLDETSLAAKLADGYGVKRNTMWINKHQFAENVQQIFNAMDQPTVDGVNTYLVSQAASRAGMKVALSGLGGDELFGSYPSFADVPRSVRNLAAVSHIPALGRGFRVVTAAFLTQFTSPKYAGLLEYGGTFEGAYLLRRGLYMPWELPKVLEPEMVKEGWETLRPIAQLKESIPKRASAFNKVSALEISWYMRSQLLRDSDWAGMAHSLEIRVPMVDIDLFRKLGRLSALPTPPTKADLAYACAGDIAKVLVARPKSGFSVPVGQWVRELGLTSGTERGLRDWAKTVYSKHHPRSPVHARERVLVFRVGNLGDTLVSLPAISKIRLKHPHASLCLLTNDEPRKPNFISTWSVAKPLGYFDGLITYNIAPHPLKRLIETIKLVRQLRRLAPQTAYYLTPRRTSWQHRRDAFFFHTVLSVKEYSGVEVAELPGKAADGNLPRLRPEWLRLYEIVDTAPPTAYKINLPHVERLRAQELISHIRPQPVGPWIAICPGSKMPAKVWSCENFALLGTQILSSLPGAHLLILGGAEDYELGSKLIAAWGQNSTNLAGKLSIFGSAAVLEQCDIYIGNDTGTMHLAAMVATPCIAIFSARDYPGLWEPYGDGHVVIRKDVECAGCMLEVCSKMKNKCLNLIDVQEVLMAALKKLPVRQEFSVPATSPLELMSAVSQSIDRGPRQ